MNEYSIYLFVCINFVDQLIDSYHTMIILLILVFYKIKLTQCIFLQLEWEEELSVSSESQLANSLEICFLWLRVIKHV